MPEETHCASLVHWLAAILVCYIMVVDRLCRIVVDPLRRIVIDRVGGVVIDRVGGVVIDRVCLVGRFCNDLLGGVVRI
jgi:hypothetical protein